MGTVTSKIRNRHFNKEEVINLLREEIRKDLVVYDCQPLTNREPGDIVHLKTYTIEINGTENNLVDTLRSKRRLRIISPYVETLRLYYHHIFIDDKSVDVTYSDYNATDNTYTFNITITYYLRGDKDFFLRIDNTFDPEKAEIVKEGYRAMLRILTLIKTL